MSRAGAGPRVLCGGVLVALLAACGSSVETPGQTSAGAGGAGAASSGEQPSSASVGGGASGGAPSTVSAGVASGGAPAGVGGGPSGACLSDAAGKPLALVAPSTAYALAPGVRLNVHVDDVAIGDVTGDGRADIVGAGYEGIVVAAQTADGGVGDAQVFPTVGNTCFALLRADADALYDVALGSYNKEGQLHRADGQGGFLAAEMIGSPLSGVLRTADIDGDGRTDLVTDEGADGIYIAHGTATGPAAPAKALVALDFSWQLLAIRDLDGDLAPDLVTRSLSPDALRVVPNDGMGGLLLDAAWEIPIADDEFDGGFVAFGDANGDGVLDLVRQHELGFASYDARVRLAPGSIDAGGTLSFGPWQEIGATGYAGPLEVTDLDGDGRDDVVAVHEAQFQVGFSISHDDGMGPWQLHDMPTAATNTGPPVVGDIDCDGCPDVLALDGGIVYFRGLGCGR